MDEKILLKLVKEGKSFNEISKETKKSLTTIRYWTKKYGIESNFKSFTEQKSKEYGDFRYCPSCKQECSIENFYNRRGKKYSSVYCKDCTKEQSLKRQRKLKKQMVEYKGNKCERCGYHKYIGALEFHHIDPSVKDFNPSSLKRYTFDEKIKNELDKCILLCANCHREVHHELKLN